MIRTWPSIYSSPICGQPHPRNDWRCTLAEGHTGPHSVSLTAYWEPLLERDAIEGEPHNGYKTFTKGDLREAGSGKTLTADEIEAMVIAMHKGKAGK